MLVNTPRYLLHFASNAFTISAYRCYVPFAAHLELENMIIIDINWRLHLTIPCIDVNEGKNDYTKE